MNIDFNEEEMIFLYGFLSQKIKELTKLKNHPKNPISSSTLDADIALYSSITQKLSDAAPSLKKLDKI